MLCARQLRPATVAGEAEQVPRYERHRPPRTSLPGGVGRRVHDNLTHDSPARVVRIAAGDQKSRQRLGHPVRTGLGPVPVEMSQCGADATSVVNRSGELPRSRARFMGSILDPPSVVGGRSLSVPDQYPAKHKTASSARIRTRAGRPEAEQMVTLRSR
jgi:hypothetical protein